MTIKDIPALDLELPSLPFSQIVSGALIDALSRRDYDEWLEDEMRDILCDVGLLSSVAWEYSEYPVSTTSLFNSTAIGRAFVTLPHYQRCFSYTYDVLVKSMALETPRETPRELAYSSVDALQEEGNSFAHFD